MRSLFTADIKGLCFNRLKSPLSCCTELEPLSFIINIIIIIIALRNKWTAILISENWFSQYTENSGRRFLNS